MRSDILGKPAKPSSAPAKIHLGNYTVLETVFSTSQYKIAIFFITDFCELKDFGNLKKKKFSTSRPTQSLESKFPARIIAGEHDPARIDEFPARIIAGEHDPARIDHFSSEDPRC